MTVRLSFLAILDQGPCYGYQLGAEFARRNGSSAPVNAGQIYNTLDRLERDGLVTKRDPDADGQVYFEITASGRREVVQWFASPLVTGTPQHSDVVEKIALAIGLSGVDANAVIETQMVATDASLRQLRAESLSDSDGPATGEWPASLVRQSRILAAEAELAWLASTKETVRKASAAGKNMSLPLLRDLPKRGRPTKAALVPK